MNGGTARPPTRRNDDRSSADPYVLRREEVAAASSSTPATAWRLGGSVLATRAGGIINTGSEAAELQSGYPDVYPDCNSDPPPPWGIGNTVLTCSNAPSGRGPVGRVGTPRPQCRNARQRRSLESQEPRVRTPPQTRALAVAGRRRPVSSAGPGRAMPQRAVGPCLRCRRHRHVPVSTRGLGRAAPHGFGVDAGVPTRAADEVLVAGAAVNHVVARAPDERVVVAVATIE